MLGAKYEWYYWYHHIMWLCLSRHRFSTLVLSTLQVLLWTGKPLLSHTQTLGTAGIRGLQYLTSQVERQVV